MNGSSETVHFERERGVTDVRVTRGVAHVTAQLSHEPIGNARLELLKRLADASIPVFLVKLHPTGISFALRDDQVKAGLALLQEIGVPHTVLPDLGLVATVAGAMRDLSGVIAAIYEALVTNGIRVRQTGDAYNAVLCLVAGEDADRAARALRDCFSLPALLTATEADAGSGLRPL